MTLFRPPLSSYRYGSLRGTTPFCKINMLRLYVIHTSGVTLSALLSREVQACRKAHSHHFPSPLQAAVGAQNIAKTIFIGAPAQSSNAPPLRLSHQAMLCKLPSCEVLQFFPCPASSVKWISISMPRSNLTDRPHQGLESCSVLRYSIYVTSSSCGLRIILTV